MIPSLRGAARAPACAPWLRSLPKIRALRAQIARRARATTSQQAVGLIVSIGRRGLHRLFDPGILERLALIALGRTAGFSLDEIARMFAPDGRPRIDRQLLAAKAKDLDRTIRELSVIRDGLRHAAACSRPSHMECPAFRRILRITASKAMRGPGKKAPQPRKTR